MSPDRSSVHNLLAQLPVNERLCVLVVSIMATEHGAVRPIVAVINVAVELAHHLSTSDRASVAAHMRLLADDLDTPRWN